MGRRAGAGEEGTVSPGLQALRVIDCKEETTRGCSFICIFFLFSFFNKESAFVLLV